MSVVRLTTAAGAWVPVQLAEAEAFARIHLVEDQVVLQRLIEAATREVERYSGHVLVPGTFRLTFDSWSRRLELPVTPITAIAAVRYLGVDGSTTTLSSGDYTADLGTVPARLSFAASYIPVTLRDIAGLEVEVTAGYPTVYAVPADIQQHVITLALLMHEHRDDPIALRQVRRYAAEGGSAFEVARL